MSGTTVVKRTEYPHLLEQGKKPRKAGLSLEEEPWDRDPASFGSLAQPDFENIDAGVPSPVLQDVTEETSVPRPNWG